MALSEKVRNKSYHRLAQLTVAEVDAAVEETYSRSQFGYGWYDLDKDGQNERAEMLIRFCQQPETTLKFATDADRRVVEGLWFCRFTGDKFTDASDLDVDHFVPLKNAWISGAHAWTKERRVQYANGYQMKGKRRAWLVPVSASANRSKSDRSPDAWLPEREKYVSKYVAIWIKTKAYWGLSITPAEWKTCMDILDADAAKVTAKA